MSNDWQKVGFFAAGLAIGGVATATLVLGPYSPAARNKMMPAKPVPTQAATVAFRGAECPMEPVVIITGKQDGRYRMPVELSGYASTEPNVFVAMGNEASAAGRAHDAEIAYLMACRVADRFKGAGSVAAADARYELARHYSNLANASDKDAPNCGEMLRRAELMYSDSHQLYRASYGADHEKSRKAEQGLADVRQTLMAQAGIPATAPAAAPPEPPTAAATQPEAGAITNDRAQTRPAFPMTAKPQTRPMQIEKARARSPQKKVAARQMPLGSACASARTKAQKLICSDAELARLDRELGYLQARARNASRYEREWSRREAMCTNRACLMQVFSSWRSQLLADINSG